MWIELVVGSLRLGADDHMLNHSSRAAKCFLVSQTTLHYKGMKKSKISRFVRSPLCGLFQDRFPDVNLRPCLLFFPFRVALILNTRRAQPWWRERRWGGGGGGGEHERAFGLRFVTLMSILGLQPRDMAAMLVVNTIKNCVKELTWKWILVSSGERCFCSWPPISVAAVTSCEN